MVIYWLAVHLIDWCSVKFKASFTRLIFLKKKKQHLVSKIYNLQKREDTLPCENIFTRRHLWSILVRTAEFVIVKSKTTTVIRIKSVKYDLRAKSIGDLLSVRDNKTRLRIPFLFETIFCSYHKGHRSCFLWKLVSKSSARSYFVSVFLFGPFTTFSFQLLLLRFINCWLFL